MARDTICELCRQFKRTEKEFDRWLCTSCRDKFDAVEETFYSKSRFLHLIEEADKNGFESRPLFVIQGARVRFAQGYLYLNGQLCKFSAIAGRSKLAPPRGREYWHPVIYGFGDAKFLAIQTGDGQEFSYEFFLIPSVLVYGVSINIPVTGCWSEYQQKRRPQVDWFQYRGNWKVLGDRKGTRPVSAQYLAISPSTSPA